ncbi:hypothetical protein KUCAC02_027380 [Chaenocephalus aceratus]|uniref:Uncharacterized protein n=1 Tax=Chaenocephalus aceratus TaxID=36190 RepID=A0ACB9W3L3_CHAAC|nr:hypothetical protein KUCAC02_027380 [Chaenocephalus aceratus]
MGYPITPSLFSYMKLSYSRCCPPPPRPTLSSPSFPSWASAAQLMQSASSTHTDRALIPPRLYYPFLCEHAFGQALGQSDASKALKTSNNSLEASPSSGFQPKVNLWKATAKEGKANWCLKRTGAPIGNHEAPVEKKPNMGGFALDLLKNIQTASNLNMTADKLLFHGSLQDAQLPTRHTDLWYSEHLTSPSSETSSQSTCGGPNRQDPNAARTIGEGASESVAALLSDLSKALQEYQEAERKISHLEKEDIPAQRHLWEHLGKIRSELSHIHTALERSSRQSDGPLDLSVKRDQTDVVGDRSTREDETTKCEADSSVLLCPDGRSVVFTDIPSSAKTPKRPLSIQRLEAHPPSPLTATDN